MSRSSKIRRPGIEDTREDRIMRAARAFRRHARPEWVQVMRQIHVAGTATADTVSSASAAAAAAAPKAPLASPTTTDPSMRELKQSISGIMREYLATGVIVEAVRDLRALGCPHYLHEGVKRVCCMAMDGGERELALASDLIERLSTSGAASPHVVEQGFQRLLAATDDLSIDVPNAGGIVARLLATAAASGVISGAFCDKLPAAVLKSMAPDGAARLARSLFRMYGKTRTKSVDLLHAPDLPVASLKQKIASIAQEFLEDSLLNDTEQALRRLASPHYLHELVVRVFVLAIDHGEREVRLASNLVEHLHHKGVLTREVARLGYVRLLERCDDLSLDAPRASAIVAEALLQAVSDGVLEPDFMARLPPAVKAGLGRAGQFAAKLFALYADVGIQHQLSPGAGDVSRPGGSK